MGILLHTSVSCFFACRVQSTVIIIITNGYVANSQGRIDPSAEGLN